MAFTRTIGRGGVLAAVTPDIARERISRRAEAVAGAIREAYTGPGLEHAQPPEMSLADRFEHVAFFGNESRASSELARMEREAAPLLEGAEARPVPPGEDLGVLTTEVASMATRRSMILA